MTTIIRWNGSKWAGEAPDPIELLLERLATYTLTPSLAGYGTQSAYDPTLTHFFGNFVEVSAGFGICTDDPDLIASLNRLIRANVQTPAYKDAKQEYEADLRRRKTARGKPIGA